jgi:hypothetical protein
MYNGFTVNEFDLQEFTVQPQTGWSDLVSTALAVQFTPGYRDNVLAYAAHRYLTQKKHLLIFSNKFLKCAQPNYKIFELVAPHRLLWPSDSCDDSPSSESSNR